MNGKSRSLRVALAVLLSLQAWPTSAEDEDDDPDMPAFLKSRVDKETFFRLRNEQFMLMCRRHPCA